MLVNLKRVTLLKTYIKQLPAAQQAQASPLLPSFTPRPDGLAVVLASNLKPMVDLVQYV